MLFQCILCVGFFGSIAVCDSCGRVTEGPNTTNKTATTEKEEQEQEHHQKPSPTTRTTTQQMQSSQKKKEELHHVHGLGLTQCLVIANKPWLIRNMKVTKWGMNRNEWLLSPVKHSYFCTLSIHFIVWFGPKERSKGLIEFASIKLLDLSLRLGRFDLQVHRLFQALLPVVLSSL